MFINRMQKHTLSVSILSNVFFVQRFIYIGGARIFISEYYNEIPEYGFREIVCNKIINEYNIFCNYSKKNIYCVVFIMQFRLFSLAHAPFQSF